MGIHKAKCVIRKNGKWGKGETEKKLSSSFPFSPFPFFLVIVLAVGCGRDGPERTIVSGTVTYGGQPVEDGQIRFFPAKGTQAPMSGGRIVDGQYSVDTKGGVAIGTHRIEITAHRPDPKHRELTESLPPDATELERPPQQQYIPEKYNSRTELEITIPPESRKITKNFELTD